MGAPGWGAAIRVVNLRQDRSIFKLSKWLRKSYRRAIEANIRAHSPRRFVELQDVSGASAAESLVSILIGLDDLIRDAHSLHPRSAWPAEARCKRTFTDSTDSAFAIVVDHPGPRQGRRAHCAMPECRSSCDSPLLPEPPDLHT